MPQVQKLSGVKHIFKNRELYIKAMERGEIGVGDEVIIEDDGIPKLPIVSEADEGKVLQVKDGQWVAEKLPTYEGEYVVTPSAGDAQTLLTAGKLTDSNITVEKIPYSETATSNTKGKTVSIG